jgi:hypothetical protein
MNNNIFNKTTIIVLLIIFVGLTLYIFKDDNHSTTKMRTIMIYMSGSDLESKVGAATSDINAIKSSEVDLNSMNIILYTGGSSKWHTDLVNSTENAIYELQSEGFTKIKTYNQKNMSTSDTLESFLDYVYDNYKTDRYDLIVWDHGGAWQGAVSDDFNEGDYLELKEFKEALSNSPFKKNKLEAILFKTCLNSSYEVGVALKDYSDYLIASEEVTFAGNVIHALDFLNDIDGDTDPVNLGIMYADSYYNNTIVKGNLQNRRVMAFSVIDLSKIDTLSDELASFFNGIDINEYYEDISRVRDNLHEYGGNNVKTFDIVDAYHLIDDLSSYSTYDSEKVLKAFDDAVVNCYSTNETTSKCLSIFFPFNGLEKAKNYGLKIYKTLAFNDDYYNFINNFNFKQSQAETSSSMLQLDEGHFTNNIEINNKVLSLTLTDDEKKDILEIKYHVFAKENDKYHLIKTADNIMIDGNNLVIDLSNKYLKINNDYVSLKYIDGNYKVDGYLSNELKSIKEQDAKVNFTIGENHQILLTEEETEGEVVSSLVYDYNDYNYISFNTNNYKFKKDFDNKWQDSLDENIKTINKDELDINLGYLSSSGDYYCLLEIRDLNNKVHYTKLEKIK